MSDTPPPRLILASGSPRRRELLAELGVPFAVVVSNAPETVPPGTAIDLHAIALAQRKVETVAADRGGLVLGADTIVVLDDEVLGKPEDDEDAKTMLRRLSGRTHRVITGLSLLDAATGWRRQLAVTSVVSMKLLTARDIAAYVATGEPRDKAGGYAIQGVGSGLIARHEGCFNNVVGLPLCAVAEMLTGAGIIPPETWHGCRLPHGEDCPRESSRIVPPVSPEVR